MKKPDRNLLYGRPLERRNVRSDAFDIGREVRSWMQYHARCDPYRGLAGTRGPKREGMCVFVCALCVLSVLSVCVCVLSVCLVCVCVCA